MEDKTPSELFGENLRKLRRKYGDRNAKDFIKKLGIKSEGSIYYYYERGEAFPDLETIIKIVEELDITFELLFKPFLKQEDQELMEIFDRIKRVWRLVENRNSLNEQLSILEDRLKKEISPKRKREAGGNSAG